MDGSTGKYNKKHQAFKFRKSYALCCASIPFLSLILYLLLSTYKYNEVGNGVIISADNKNSRSNGIFQLSSERKSPKKEQKKEPTIAYVFAGSVRSFVYSKVHWSIKLNLIDAFGAKSFTFIRLSVVDNANLKTGDGIFENPVVAANDINETLKILNPRVVQYISIDNQSAEMEYHFPSLRHRVFRVNDRRRYSMFYNRYMAYRLVLSYEKENNMKFDWVVLARLDALWLEPVLPISYYGNDRAWLTETGYSMLNDQFMLIPRQFSDHVFSLETKVSGYVGEGKPVYCLGGPDVEKWKCNQTELINHKYDLDFASATFSSCCPKPMKSKHEVDDQYGFSERIHMRHLEMEKIPVSLARFPVLLVRRNEQNKDQQGNYDILPECWRLQVSLSFYLISDRFKIYPYFAPTGKWNDMYWRPFNVRDHMACLMLFNPVHKWKPIAAAEFHEYLSKNLNMVSPPNAVEPRFTFRPTSSQHTNNFKPLDYSKSLESQRNIIHPSIFPNPKDLEVFRIHPTWNMDGCLTYYYRVKKLTWSHCVEHERFNSGNGNSARYSILQIFFLYIIPAFDPFHIPYIQGELDFKHLYDIHKEYNEKYITQAKGYNITRVMNYGTPIRNLKVQCLTVVGGFTVQAPLSMQACDTGPTLDPGLFNVSNFMGNIAPKERLYWRQAFLTVQGVAKGSHPLTTVGLIRLFANPSLCVSRAGSMPDVQTTSEYLKTVSESSQTPNIFQLALCDTLDMTRHFFDFEMLIN